MQIDDSKLETIRGKVVNIGSTVLADFVPEIHWVVIKTKEGYYVSSCIDLHVDGYGETEKKAVSDMIEHANDWLKRNFDEDNKEHCWSNLLELFNTGSSELWDKYYAFQLMQAERACATKEIL